MVEWVNAWMIKWLPFAGSGHGEWRDVRSAVSNHGGEGRWVWSWEVERERSREGEKLRGGDCRIVLLIIAQWMLLIAYLKFKVWKFKVQGCSKVQKFNGCLLRGGQVVLSWDRYRDFFLFSWSLEFWIWILEFTCQPFTSRRMAGWFVICDLWFVDWNFAARAGWWLRSYLDTIFLRWSYEKPLGMTNPKLF